jgi:hypothetical protein
MPELTEIEKSKVNDGLAATSTKTKAKDGGKPNALMVACVKWAFCLGIPDYH